LSETNSAAKPFWVDSNELARMRAVWRSSWMLMRRSITGFSFAFGG